MHSCEHLQPSFDSGGDKALHCPVLLTELLGFFEPRHQMRIFDGTLGLGGHAEALLRKASEQACSVELLGVDRDADALALAAHRLAAYEPRFFYQRNSFSQWGASLDQCGWSAVDFALLDIGVSSMQLDTPGRGFSFLRDGPLDMRMDSSQGTSAANLVNKASVSKLAELIGLLGEEPLAGRIARAIEAARSRKPIERTLELATIVEQAYPAKRRFHARRHPATKTFQALRMAVNNELGELQQFLEQLPHRLRPGGRIAVITFHSLEDRLVKHFFKEAAATCRCPKSFPVCTCSKTADMRVLTRKPLVSTPLEISINPRAQSAKLRVAERL